MTRLFSLSLPRRRGEGWGEGCRPADIYRVALGIGMSPNSEAAAAQPPGSTGYQPVPSGYQPLGMTTVRALLRCLVWLRGRLAVPSGQWPDGTGWQPVLPIPTSEFGFRAGLVRLAPPVPDHASLWNLELLPHAIPLKAAASLKSEIRAFQSPRPRPFAFLRVQPWFPLSAPSLHLWKTDSSSRTPSLGRAMTA